MENRILNMIQKYNPVNLQDHINILREILQRVILMGLGRMKFFNKAAFYGGTALRIIHGLDRYSEDMDFSLIKPEKDFDFSYYLPGIKNEILSFGFEAELELKKKSHESPIQSAFLKADTLKQLVSIEVDQNIINELPKGQKIKIRIEIDTNPPSGFNTETSYILQPVPFSVRAFQLPDLFAGKMHALLCRKWKNRVKGRDWYDLIWYVANHPTLHLNHLEERMKQTGHLKMNQNLNNEKFKKLYNETVKNLNINQARNDVVTFIKDADSLEIWSEEFFLSLLNKIEIM